MKLIFTAYFVVFGNEPKFLFYIFVWFFFHQKLSSTIHTIC